MVRFKNRYLVCEINNGDTNKTQMKFSEYEFLNCIKNAIKKYHGDYGFGCIMTSIAVKYLNLKTGIVIIRSKRGCHLMVQSTLTFINKIKEHDIMLHTLHIGGTMKSCQKFLVRHHQKQLTDSLSRCKTNEEKKAVRQAMKRSDGIVKINAAKKYPVK